MASGPRLLCTEDGVMPAIWGTASAPRWHWEPPALPATAQEQEGPGLGPAALRWETPDSSEEPPTDRDPQDLP